MFYEFCQNNSGGGFDFDEDSGITHHVIIEAASAEEANLRAERIGLYWNGCEDGLDCSCCGDRWYPQFTDDKGSEVPEVYGQPMNALDLRKWMPDGKEVAVHYADGRIEWFGANTKEAP